MKINGMQGVVLGVMAVCLAWPARGAETPKVEEKKLAGTIVKAKEAIVVDGKLDEADWSRAQVVAVEFVYAKKDVRSEKPVMNVRYLWDDGYLYIGYEIFDTNLEAEADGERQGPLNNQRPGCKQSAPEKKLDLVEFFPIFDDRHLFWELHHNASNQFNDLLCVADLPSWKKTQIAFARWNVYWARNEIVQDEGERTFASAVMLKPRNDGKPSTINDSSDEDTGYTAELRLPWFGIGAPAAAQGKGKGEKPLPWKMGGREISILAVYQNPDLPEAAYHTSGAALNQNFFHVQTDQFPRYTLSEE